ncbi:hypothetical protein A2121_02150 [Candidatus Nomurabacteria bacterium GWB1_40_6]|uniref:Uncharacterized protein n=1 Tax=Candidatus Nomurabacteria bacterium GWB1_40_6 TaxID=1801727 RepID=A0A1F6TL70_9BACT|nr:MAG: hypothetical protein A2121_02150 [Candidatus Nomurabacteria bacterium GWB1_40_6]
MNTLISVLVGLGIGSITTAFVSNWLDRKKEVELNLKKILEDKYRGLLVFMACALDIEKKKYFTINEQVAQKTSQDYLNQVREYYYHGTLYSSDEVILVLKSFIKLPNKETYVGVAQAMRNDLWGRKTKLNFDDINIEK